MVDTVTGNIGGLEIFNSMRDMCSANAIGMGLHVTCDHVQKGKKYIKGEDITTLSCHFLFSFLT